MRRALAADSASVAALVGHYWTFEGIAGFDAPRVQALLCGMFDKPEVGACWLAEHAGSVCGYLLAVFVFSLEHGGMTAEIDEFFVLPEIRSAGVGSALLQHAQRDLAAMRLVRLQLQLGVANERARLFYQRCGFRPRAGYALLDKPL